MSCCSVDPGILEILFFWFMALAVFWYLLRLARPGFWRVLGRNWPLASATIQKAGVANVSLGREAVTPFSFFSYVFEVDGTKYLGFFGISATQEHAEKLQKTLNGKPIQICYKPSNPKISFIIDKYDLRFEGLTASQNPEWLDSMPQPDLQYSTS